MLTSMCTHLKIVQKDGMGGFIKTELLKNADTLIKTATDTITLSYVLCKILDSIPALKAPAARKKEALNLLDDLKDRRFKAPPTVRFQG